MTLTITTITSAAFAVALTALIRRQWPQVTGWITPAVVLVLTIAGGLLGQYGAAIPPLVWIVVGPVVAAVLALGGVQVAQDTAKKGQTPAETNALDVIPPAPKAPTIIRDTTPEDTTHAE